MVSTGAPCVGSLLVKSEQFRVIFGRMRRLHGSYVASFSHMTWPELRRNCSLNYPAAGKPGGSLSQATRPCSIGRDSCCVSSRG